MRNHVDLPRLEALNRQWREFPPLQVQMQRLALYFGIAAEKTDATQQTPAKQEEQELQISEMFEVRPMPKIMSQEEYLAQRAAEREANV